MTEINKNIPVPPDVVEFKNLIKDVLDLIDQEDPAADNNAIANAISKEVFDHLVMASSATVSWFKYLRAVGVIRDT